jgi:mannosylfructose-phosphate synthase
MIMRNTPSNRIMMISTHGYVAAEPELGKPDTGGQVVYILELSKCLSRMGYHVDIFTRRFENQPFTDRIDERTRLIRFPCGGTRFIPKEYLCRSIPEWVENVARWMQIERHSYKFISSHYWDAGLAGQALANRFTIPHVHTPHSIGAWKRDNMQMDADEMEAKYNFAERIREEKVVYDECDMLIATTPIQRDILSGSEYDSPTDKICVIPPGYDDHRFFPVSTASRQLIKRQLGLSGKIILALGRLAKNKGYDLLLRAMPHVFQRVDDANLVLAIGSTALNALERSICDSLHDLSAELGIADRVHFMDYISDDDLPSYYRAAEVFALSSRYEPFGMTAIEAMACGTPTVLTTEGGLCEQIAWGIEAIYANPFDPEAYGHAIASVLQHPRVSAQLSKFAPRKARSCFTWTGIAQQLLSILETRRDKMLMERIITLPPTSSIVEESLWSA